MRKSHAVRLAAVLEQPVEKLFPPRKEVKGKKGEDWQAKSDRESADSSKTQIDPDNCQWYVQCELRGGHTINLPVSSFDMKRIDHVLQRGSPGFVCFASSRHSYAVNLDHVRTCQILFEPFAVEQIVPYDDDPDYLKARVIFADDPEPFTFSVDDAPLHDKGSKIDIDDWDLEKNRVWNPRSRVVTRILLVIDVCAHGSPLFKALRGISARPRPRRIVRRAAGRCGRRAGSGANHGSHK